jgi:23S rRNA (guanosine2251-2'-O)-methyltransferase
MQKSQIRNTEWLWGLHAVKAAWENPERAIHSLLVTDKTAKMIEAWNTPKGSKRPQADKVDKAVITKRLPQGAVHQGLAIQCAPLEEVFLSDLMIKAKSGKSLAIAMLDQVTDPHNVGAIMRSACAFQMDAIIVQSRHAPEMTGTLAKAACGAVEHIALIRETNLSRAIEQLQDNQIAVYGLDEDGTLSPDEAASRHVKPHSLHCLVFGAEGAGLRPKIKEHCDALIRLPTGGAVPTLNVSNAAAVAFYTFSGK